MALWMNISMAMFTTMSIIFGITYYHREKGIGRLRWYIFILGMACACANFGYMLMSITEISPWTLVFRDVGLVGVNLYVYFEILLVLDQIQIKKSYKYLWGSLVGIYGAITMICHGWPGDVTFKKVDGFTVFVNNHRFSYYMQTSLTILMFIVCLSIAIIWLVQQKTKRGRSFVILCFIANFLYVFSSFPYFLGMESEQPGFFYCLGTMVAYFVIWFAGNRFSGFSVTTQNLSTDIFENFSEGLLIFDEEGQLVMRNACSKEMLGIDNINNQKLFEIFDDITEAKSDGLFFEMVNGAEKKTGIKFRKAGKIFSANFTLKKDIFKDPLCIICVVTDITKEEQMIAEVIAANEAKSDFLASMSHEIRTPINAVLGMNEMIIRESKENNIVEYAKDVESSGRMLLSLINDILDFSKVESGKIEINPGPYDVASFINDIYNMLIFKAKEKGLDFIIEVDEAMCSRLVGDEIRVRQIVINLLTNAIKYTEKGYVKLVVKGSKESERDYRVTFRVEDTGKGIKEEDIDKLFDSFTRVDVIENKNIEGTGLGLALTKNFSKIMGGDVSVESTYKKGSIFTATIIQGIDAEEPIGNFSTRIEKNRNEINRNNVSIYAPKAQILVVDDVEMNCKVFCNLLKKSQMNIDVALSGMEALEKCKNKRYDIIYMDHRMPKMDGIECMRELKKLHTLNDDTPVVMLTANAIVGMKEIYIEEGFVDFLSKPIDYKSLEKTICRLIPKLLENKHVNINNTEREEIVKEQSVLEKIGNELPQIDIELGMNYCMNDENFFVEVLKEYVKCARYQELEKWYLEKNWKDFRIVVHAVKSTSLNIGAKDVSESAKQLEKAAADSNSEYIEANMVSFLRDYAALLDGLKGLLG